MSIYIGAKYFAEGYDYANKETTKSKTYGSPDKFATAVDYSSPTTESNLLGTVAEMHYAWQITEGKSLDYKGLMTRIAAGNSDPEMQFLPTSLQG